MQGSTIVTMPNGKVRTFNVSKSNGYTYDKTLRRPWKQKKYWYFKEVKPHERQLINYGGALFAGDLAQLGLGKIIALHYKNPLTKKQELHLGVLADRGSAFSNNLYQLDLFAGIFNTKNQFQRYIKQFPNTVHAYILAKK